MATLTLDAVRKSYGDREVVHGVSCAVADGELVVVVGPSGCGKSTLLRMVAGLETVTAGTVAIDGRVVNGIEPKDRDIAMVFQNYALSAYERVRQHGLRAAHAQHAASRDQGPGRPRRRYPATRRPAAAQTAAIVGRAAAAGGDGPGDRARPEGVPVRRAAVEPRRQVARPDAGRDQAAAAGARHHLALRDARPGRGDDPGRPADRDEPRECRPDRSAARSVREPGDRVR